MGDDAVGDWIIYMKEITNNFSDSEIAGCEFRRLRKLIIDCINLLKNQTEVLTNKVALRNRMNKCELNSFLANKNTCTKTI